MALSQVHLTATFTGEFMGVHGTGRPIEVWVANPARFADDGRLREHWGLGREGFGRMLVQMGIDAGAMTPSVDAYAPA